MRILIVSAFHANAQGNEQAEEFENSIKGAYRRVYSCDTARNEFITARLGDLWEYIYLAGTEFSDVAAQAKFDTLDAVCIDGSSALMPWDEAAWPLVILVKLCMVHRKFTLAAGPGNLCAAFVCATGGRKMHVVHCGPLDVGEELQPAESEWDNVEDVLVDQATGDYYTYNWNTVTWVPQGNSGIYHYRAAQRSRSNRSSYENNSPRIAGPKAVHRNFMDHRCNDDPRRQPLGAPRGQAIVRIRPDGGKGWRGFTGFETNDFNVELASDWCLHETANRTNHHKYMVTAESESGPLCYQFNNLWGLGFHVTARYVASVMVVRNFAQHMTECVADVRGGMTSAREQQHVVMFDRGQILVGHGSNLAPPRADDVTSMNHAMSRNTHAGYATARSGRPIRCRHGIKHENKQPKAPVDNLWKRLWDFTLANGMNETLDRFAQQDKKGSGLVTVPELRHVMHECIGKSVPKERIEDIMKEALELIEDMNDGGADNGEVGAMLRGMGKAGRGATAKVQMTTNNMALDYALFLDSLGRRFVYDQELKEEEEAKFRSYQQQHAGDGSRTARSQTSRTRPVSRGTRLDIIAKRLGVELPVQHSEPSEHDSQGSGDHSHILEVEKNDDAAGSKMSSKAGTKAGSKGGLKAEGSKHNLPQLDLSSVHGSRHEDQPIGRDGDAAGPEEPHEVTEGDILNGTGIKFSGGVPYAVPREAKKVVRSRLVSRPHSTYRKFVEMRAQRESPRTFKNGRDAKEFVAVVDDRAPFMTSEERSRWEEVEGKKKWMGTKGFQSAFGKRSEMPLRKDYGVRAEGPYFTDPREPYKKKDHKEKWITPGVDMYLAGTGANIGINEPNIDRTLRTTPRSARWT